MTRKLLIVLGTRPEAIKMAPLILKAKKSARLSVKVCVSGQHRQMLDQVLSLFNIIPDFDLNIMQPGQTLNGITTKLLEGLDSIFQKESFDYVLVHGDTSTTMATSLAAFHHRIPVAHIEAGLRTYNNSSPWPEEANRRIVGVLANWHFAPTLASQQNLLNEKVPAENILVTGNTVIDALQSISKKLDEDSGLAERIKKDLGALDLSKKIILVTGHRRENLGVNFESLCQGLKKIADSFDVQIVYPVHLNPRVQEPANRILGNSPNILLLPPQDYLPFVYLMKNSYLIITDSGGIQEEAPSLGVPVLVTRDTTERPEAISSGTAKLVGTDGENLFKETATLLTNEKTYIKMKMSINPYGDGLACDRIISALENAIPIR